MSKHPAALTIAEIEALQPRHSTRLTQRVCRPVSKYLTWLFLRLGVPAAAVIATNIAVGVLGAACLAYPHMGVSLLFIPLAYIGEVLDCSDGEVARGSGTSDATFAFADIAGHYFVTPLVVLALGVREALEQQALIPLVLGAIAAIFCTPTITLYRVRASILLEEMLERATRGPVAVHPLLASRAERLPGDFGFERLTHRYRLPLGTGLTVVTSVALLGQWLTGLRAISWLLMVTAIVFPLWRIYDYAATILAGKPAKELRRILREP